MLTLEERGRITRGTRMTKKEHKIIQTVKFAHHDNVSDTPPDILQGRTVNEYLELHYGEAGGAGHSLLHHGAVKRGGWRFQFNLNRYLYKQYGQWQEGYAPNRTALRKAVYGRIDLIIDLEVTK